MIGSVVADGSGASGSGAHGRHAAIALCCCWQTLAGSNLPAAHTRLHQCLLYTASCCIAEPDPGSLPAMFNPNICSTFRTEISYMVHLSASASTVVRMVSRAATVRKQGANQFKRMARTAALFSTPALTTLDTVLIRTRGTASLALAAAYFVEGVRANRLELSHHRVEISSRDMAGPELQTAVHHSAVQTTDACKSTPMSA